MTSSLGAISGMKAAIFSEASKAMTLQQKQQAFGVLASARNYITSLKEELAKADSPEAIGMIEDKLQYFTDLQSKVVKELEQAD